MRRTSFVLANKVPFGKDSTIFQRLSIPELLRTMFVFRLCSINYLVERSPQLLDLSSRLIGAHMTYDVLARHTFYVQFCAGRDEEEIKPALKALQDQGIGPILDYAAEAPVDATEEAKKSTASVLEVNLRKLLHASDIVYASDSPLDANVALFISSIESAAATMNPGGVAFAAVKVTGLCDCQLLARISAIMLRIRQTWAEYYIPENEGVAPNLENCREVCSRSRAPAAAPRRCPHDAFREGLLRMAPTLTEPEVEQILAYFDKDGKGYVHYFDYTHLLRTAIMNADETPAVLKPFLRIIPRLTKTESELHKAFERRTATIISRAAELKVRVMVDAEQTYYQMAIDALVRQLQREYNTEFPAVYNTYQGYLKHSYRRMVNDLARSKREGWVFAAKIVRGAYMETERKVAKELGYDSPIQDTKEHTHANYDKMSQQLLDEIDKGRFVALLFGTHNVNSLQMLTDRIADIEKRGDVENIDVAFAQLYGMGDHLTLPLARAGHKAFKYVPYGPVKETILYLQRRAYENKDMIGQANGEWPLLKNELKRKLFGIK
jgi:proline dehydrogenase